MSFHSVINLSREHDYMPSPVRLTDPGVSIWEPRKPLLKPNLCRIPYKEEGRRPESVPEDLPYGYSHSVPFSS